MDQAKYRKCIYCFIGCLLAGLLAVLALVVIIDPFFQYHKPLQGIAYTIDNQLEQNPGMAKTFDYDSVILGSSMTVNFNTELFKECMGLDTLKLSSNAAYPKDIDNIMQVVAQKEETVKKVFIGVDIYTYKAEPGVTAYENQPSHLYDNNLLNDVAYIFNKDVIMNYIIKPGRENTPLNEVYYSWPHMQYSKSAVAASGYQAPVVMQESVAINSYEENIAQNLENYILPYVEGMPDTEFCVFFPPYSILYWYTRMGEGTALAELQAERQLVETLFAYPNVKVYYFQNQFDYITDLENYCDYTHYNRDMNDYMTQCFAEGECELNAENYEEVFEAMEAYISGFDYEGVWP